MAVRIHNWARNESCSPARYEEPETEAEVADLVRTAVSEGLTIRAIGARHSWSDIAMDDGIVISLDRMQAVLNVDRDQLQVRVQAGIRLQQLSDELAAIGLALPIVGSIQEQSLAGVMSTGTHGSSLVHGNIPSFVVAMRLVTGTGEVLDIQSGNPLLSAARVALGALGIITEVTVAVVPAFQLVETTETIPFEQAVADMETIARSAEYVKLWWLPHTDSVVVFRCGRTRESGDISKLGRWIDEHIVNKWVFAWLLLISRFFPAAIPTINRLLAATYLKPRRTVGRSDDILTLAMPPLHRETESSVPLVSAGEALRRTGELIRTDNLRVNFIVEVRFVRADDNWMSPASGRDSCQLGAYMARAPGLDRYFDGFQTAMKELGGRPHWGKEFRSTPEELAAVYPHFDDFRKVVSRLDPQQVFRNPFVERLFTAS